MGLVLREKNFEYIVFWYYVSSSYYLGKLVGGEYGICKYSLIYREILKVLFMVLFMFKV